MWKAECMELERNRGGRESAGKWDHLPTRSGFNQCPSLGVHPGFVGTGILAGFFGCQQLEHWLPQAWVYGFGQAFACSGGQGAAGQRARLAARRTEWLCAIGMNSQFIVGAIMSKQSRHAGSPSRVHSEAYQHAHESHPGAPGVPGCCIRSHARP